MFFYVIGFKPHTFANNILLHQVQTFLVQNNKYGVKFHYLLKNNGQIKPIKQKNYDC